MTASRKRPSPADVAATAAVVVASIVTGLAARPVFDSDVLVVPVVVAAAAAGALHLGLRRRGTDVGVRVLASVLAALVVGAVATSGLPTPGALAAVVDGWVNGVARLLSSAVPAPQTPDLVVVPVTVVWLTAATGVETALGRRPWVVVLPLVAGAVALAGIGATLGTAVAATLAGAVLVTLAARRPTATGTGDAEAVAVRGGLDGRTALAGVATVVIAGVVATIAPSAPVVADRPTWDPRADQQLEAVPTRQLSPLTATIGALTLPEPVELFRVDTTAPARVRVVALDTYDGSAWRSSETYVPASRRLPRQGDAAVTATTAEVTITPTGLRGPFLPVVGRPTRIELDAFRVAPSSGDLVVADGDVSDLSSYDLTAELPTPTTELEDAFRARDRELGDLDRWTALPPLPNDLVALARSIVADAETDYEQLVALRDHFASEDYVLVDPTQFDVASGQQLPAGHAIGQVRDFLGLRESGGRPRVGTVEQYTATFTLMARILGFPARLAVGYREAADGAVVTTARSHAWPEVAMAGHGWTIWDPTPSVDEPGVQPPAPLPPADADLPEPLAPDDPVAEPVLPEVPAEGPSPFAVVAAVLAGLVLVLLLVVVGRWLVAGWRRRRRWTMAPAEERVLLVWHDIVRRLEVAGVDVDATSTGSDVIRAVRATPWAHDVVPDVGGVGGLATRAAYGRTGVDPREVPGVDESHRRVVRATREHTPWTARLRRLLRP